ncbi:MAG: 50S ribosomal protein L29 [Rickettsiales bacterium]
MKSTELKGKSTNELEMLLGNFKKELFNLRFQKVNGGLLNTARVTLVKRTIARIKTFINMMSSSSNGGNNA